MSEQQPLFTIAIPTYNRLHTLKRALKSALRQTYSNIEIIILDNASDDGTQQYLKHMQRQFSQIRLVRHQKNIGMLGNMRHIPSVMQGKYLQILSDDDSIQPEFVATAVADLETYPNASLWCCRVAINKNHYPERIMMTQSQHRYMSGDDFLHAWFIDRTILWGFCGMVYRSDILNRYNALQGSTIYFDITSVLVCAMNHDVIHNRSVLANYFAHADCTSAQATQAERVKINKQIVTDTFKLVQVDAHKQKRLYNYMGRWETNRRLDNIINNEGRDISLWQCLHILYSLLRHFTLSAAKQLCKRAPTVFMLLANYILPTRKLKFLRKKHQQIPAHIYNRENYSCQLAYEYRMLEEMIFCVCHLLQSATDISLYGSPTNVTAGKLFADYIQTLYAAEGLPTSEIVVMHHLSSNDMRYRRAYLFVEHLKRSAWGKSIKQHAFYQSGLRLRRQQLQPNNSCN